MKRLTILLGGLLLLSGCLGSGRPGAVDPAGGAPHSVARRDAVDSGIHKIRHVIIVMQENRSFDSYFGTFPGADGLPRSPTGGFTT